MKLIDSILNTITMYRLVIYVLGALASLGVLFSFLGRIHASPTALVVSLVLLIVSAYIADRGFAKFFNMPSNMESALITALILFLIVQPANSLMGGVALILAGAVSSASKFLITWNGKHLFNPAAFAAAILSLTGLQAVTWWVGSSALWPFALILGLLVVRKIRRFPPFLTFVVASSALQYFVFLHANQPVISGMNHALFASPLIFLSTIMITEPATMPPRRNMQVIFAGLIAGLYVMAWSLGPFSIYPEVALLLGNLFAFAISPKLRVRMQLKEIQKISDRVYNYVFQPDRAFSFLPGQYMEWTLANVPYDSRGNRRSFTIASSPTESEVHLGLKYYEPASMYKAAFYQMKPGDYVYASQLAGNFTMQGQERQKLAFIAGGIGITPFRSMVTYVSDNAIQCDITLVYVVSDPQDFAYMQEFQEASKVGVKVIPVVTDLSYHAPDVVTAKLSPTLLQQIVPDYAERTFYLSGSSPMVDATKDFLQTMGIKNRQIKTDHFSGY